MKKPIDRLRTRWFWFWLIVTVVFAAVWGTILADSMEAAPQPWPAIVFFVLMLLTLRAADKAGAI